MTKDSIYKNDSGAGKGPAPRPTGKSFWKNWDNINWVKKDTKKKK
jgi:hypothetical protein